MQVVTTDTTQGEGRGVWLLMSRTNVFSIIILGIYRESKANSAPCVCSAHSSQKRELDPMELELCMDDCKSPCDLNPGPLQDQQVL